MYGLQGESPMGTRDKATSAPEKTQLALPAGTLDRVKVAAEREGLSQSSWIRRWILIGLKENENTFGEIE